MKAAIYVRVSTEQQDTTVQVTELEEYCKRWKWDCALYADHVTGKQNGPGLLRLLKDARMKRMDVVIVWKLDRFGRNLRHILENIQILNDCGVRFLVPQQGLDTDKDSVMGRFFIQILGAVAELERSFIVERTQGGYKAYRAAYAAGGRHFQKFIAARGRASHSGRNLPVGRPAKIFPRDKARTLRAAGKSWAEISAALKVPTTTIRRELAKTAE